MQPLLLTTRGLGQWGGNRFGRRAGGYWDRTVATTYFNPHDSTCVHGLP